VGSIRSESGAAGRIEETIGQRRLPGGPWLCALIVTLALLLAACDSQPGGAGAPPSSAAPTRTPALTGGPGPTAVASPSAQPTTTGATGQVGLDSVCAQSVSVTAQLPTSIPAYPGARLQIGQAQGGSGLYGLCSGDRRAAIAAFYAAQLPAKGWQQLTQNPLSDTAVQMIATRGSAHIILTIEDDAQIAGSVDIIIVATGL
jgi:hypothetical protein